MRSDRPLILACLFLAGGLALILAYCTGTTSLNAAYPLANSSVHLELIAAGPAALGGIALTLLGFLLLVWALVAAILGQVVQLTGIAHRDDEVTSITRSTGRILE